MIERMGVNLGAPGDRQAENGTLWLEVPIVGGPSPNLDVHVEPEDAEYFLHHSSRVEGETHSWISASGVKGAQKIILSLSPEERPIQNYNVRLVFMEPDNVNTGDRVFDVALQGQTVMSNFDIMGQSGKVRRGMVKEFHGVRATKDLVIELTPKSEKGPILCGVEVVAETAM
jgi:hypothetical protein